MCRSDERSNSGARREIFLSDRGRLCQNGTGTITVMSTTGSQAPWRPGPLSPGTGNFGRKVDLWLGRHSAAVSAPSQRRPMFCYTATESGPTDHSEPHLPEFFHSSSIHRLLYLACLLLRFPASQHCQATPSTAPTHQSGRCEPRASEKSLPASAWLANRAFFFCRRDVIR